MRLAGRPVTATVRISNGKGTWKQVMKGLETLQRAGVQCPLRTEPGNVKKPGKELPFVISPGKIPDCSARMCRDMLGQNFPLLRRLVECVLSRRC